MTEYQKEEIFNIQLNNILDKVEILYQQLDNKPKETMEEIDSELSNIKNLLGVCFPDKPFLKSFEDINQQYVTGHIYYLLDKNIKSIRGNNPNEYNKFILSSLLNDKLKNQLKEEKKVKSTFEKEDLFKISDFYLGGQVLKKDLKSNISFLLSPIKEDPKTDTIDFLKNKNVVINQNLNKIVYNETKDERAYTSLKIKR